MVLITQFPTDQAPNITLIRCLVKTTFEIPRAYDTRQLGVSAGLTSWWVPSFVGLFIVEHTNVSALFVIGDAEAPSAGLCPQPS